MKTKILEDMLKQALDNFNTGDFLLAQNILGKLLNNNPQDLQALEMLGVIFAIEKKYGEAIQIFTKAIKLSPSNPQLLHNRGVALAESGKHEEAILDLEKSISIDKNNLDALLTLGISYKSFKLYQKSLAILEKTLSLEPRYIKALINKGCLLFEMKEYEKAIEVFNAAILIDNNSVEAYSNLGIIYYELKSYDESLVNYSKAISVNPYYAEVYNNCGNTLKELQLVNEAIEYFKKAIKLKNDYAEAYLNIGIIYKENNFLNEAIFNFSKAIELNSNLKYLQGLYFHTRMQICDWKNFQENIERLSISIIKGEKCSDSFPTLALVDSLLIHQKAAQISINDKYPIINSTGKRSKKISKNKITLGYYSSDFKEHPVSYLTAELFELHDKNKFELVAFYSGHTESSLMQKRVSSAFDRFINIRHLSDSKVADLSIEIGIDIAVDLNGLTQNNRVGVFSYRAAPIQISYLGYLATMGCKYYDYIIADKTIIPAESQQYYNEKILYLKSYQVNDSKRLISSKSFNRQELNLPENVFIFCCFNNNFKLTPHTFNGWMRILTAVPNSVLFLYADKKVVQDNLKEEALKRKINANRLIFATHINRSEYLARYKLADLFLDTLPYNAGTTASDALWAGLPVLTCMGESFASRVAASLLNAIELPELITNNQEEYEAKAIELATNPEKIKAIKEKLKQNRLKTALFDTQQFTENLELAYTKIYERYQLDLPIEHIYI